MSRANPRLVAYELLKAVSVDDVYANLELPKLIRQAGLDRRDAGFVTELSMGVLRWQALLDGVIVNCADRPIEKIDPPLRDVLRIGVYQILFMRVADHAAVNTSVDLAAEIGMRSAKGFVNAILRKALQKSVEQWQTSLAREIPAEADALAIQWSHPRWQVAALRDALGSAKSELSELLRVNNTAPKVTLVNRSGDREMPLSKLRAGKWSPYAYVVDSALEDVAELETGLAGIQDEGSQLVVLTWLNAKVEGSDSNWLDLCAGPGGKTALMAALADQANVTAVELQHHRAELVRANVAMQNNVNVIEADATSPDFADGRFDRVLIDAPCTGLGVLRRRAESRWRRTPKDVGVLSNLQLRILENATRAVRVGGVIGYATCSPHLAETEFVVEDMLKAHPDLKLLDARELAVTIPNLRNPQEFAEQTAAGPYLRLWPHRHETDGMFLALFRKTA